MYDGNINFEENFIKNFNKFIGNIFYIIIYNYSKVQIFLSKYKYYFTFITNLLNKFLNYINNKDLNSNLSIYNFNIESFTDSNTNIKYHKIIINNNDDKSDKSDNNDFEVSNVKFISIIVSINNKTYNIQLKTDNFNYYLVGNIFTKDFFIFYINYYLRNNNEIFDIQNYFIEIIDENINTIKLDKNDKILINKNSYEIIK